MHLIATELKKAEPNLPHLHDNDPTEGSEYVPAAAELLLLFARALFSLTPSNNACSILLCYVPLCSVLLSSAYIALLHHASLCPTILCPMMLLWAVCARTSTSHFVIPPWLMLPFFVHCPYRVKFAPWGANA